jgi:putative SOS response-associated peptidase YedK
MRVSEIGVLDPSYNVSLPLAKVRIPCGTGFPSPADDYLEERLDLNKHFIKHPAATYYARAEGSESKPSFRDPFKKRRYLVLTDGFYEWKKVDAKSKVPYFIRLKAGAPFAFAGLWDNWDKGEEPLETFTIITTDNNDMIKPIHNKMPVILHEKDEGLWLDPELKDPLKLLPLLKPYPSDEMEMYEVSTVVNSPKNDVQECIKPLL